MFAKITIAHLLFLILSFNEYQSFSSLTGGKRCPDEFRPSRVHENICVFIGLKDVRVEHSTLAKHHVFKASDQCRKRNSYLLTASKWNQVNYGFEKKSMDNGPIYFDNIRLLDETSTMIREACEERNPCNVMTGIYHEERLGKYFSYEILRDRTEYVFDYKINPLRTQYLGEEELDVLLIHPLGPKFYYGFAPSFGRYVSHWIICEKLGLNIKQDCPGESKWYFGKCLFIKFIDKYIDREIVYAECKRQKLTVIRIQKYEMIQFLYDILIESYGRKNHYVMYYQSYRMEDDITYNNMGSKMHVLDFNPWPDKRLIGLVPVYEVSQVLRPPIHSAQKFLFEKFNENIGPFTLNCEAEINFAGPSPLELPLDTIDREIECGNFRIGKQQVELDEQLIIVHRNNDHTIKYGFFASEKFMDVQFICIADYDYWAILIPDTVTTTTATTTTTLTVSNSRQPQRPPRQRPPRQPQPPQQPPQPPPQQQPPPPQRQPQRPPQRRPQRPLRQPQPPLRQPQPLLPKDNKTKPY
ncbi:hypothetical protein SNEBB_005584 [Seison nebaliae]|nr:hypothetical protein SNEBB_005584 [Seison nebaliae]